MGSDGAQGGAPRRQASGHKDGSRTPSHPAVGRGTAVRDVAGEGLPTLPDMAPKNTPEQTFPQLAAPARPSPPAPSHTLGVRAAIQSNTSARMPAVSAPHATTEEALPPLPAREPTLTARIRAVQPPDVARQAISELGVLARELATLPAAMEESGLARARRSSYFEAANDYLRLGRLAWEAVAEERLEQSGADAEYRQRAIVIARRITQIQQECRAASRDADSQPSRRTPFLWRRRVGLVNSGLRAWQERLAPTPDPLVMGRGLFILRGSFGLAAAGGLSLLLLDLLLGATLALLALTILAFVSQLAGALITGASVPAVAGWSVAALAALVAWVVVRRLGATGNAPLGLLLGASAWSPAHTTRNGRPGIAAIAIALRGWWLLIGVVTAPALLVALLVSGLLVSAVKTPPASGDSAALVAFAADALTRAAGPGAAVCLAALILLGLPATLVALARTAAELSGSPSWVPAARRYPLTPALSLVAPLTAGLTIALWLASPADVQRTTLFEGRAGDLPLALTLRVVILLAALTLPYLLLIALPFRLGMRRWRRAWLTDLANRRAEVESHVRRLSAADPRSGAQDTSEENLRTMQYDLVLLQFYRDKMAEAAATRFSPFRPLGAALALLILAAAALLLDPGATALAYILGH